ncbi:MAG: hypothetical protein AB1568_07560 [Thermodesulfobacteriota bacterium]
MASQEPTIAALNVLIYQGKKLCPGWDELIARLRVLLRQAAIELRGSSELLLLFSYTHPLSAISHVHEAILQVKREFSWRKEHGPLPVQVVFHYQAKNDTTSAIFDANADLWNPLLPEAVHVTRSLRGLWLQLTAGHSLPPHHFDQGDNGISRLCYDSGEAIRAEKLFPHRELSQGGPHPPCYYCGMTLHAPAACPSRLLPPEAYGLKDIGYLPFTAIGEAFAAGIANLERIGPALTAGISQASLRKNRELLVLTAYFDLFRIFQPRFLPMLAFSNFSKWVVSEIPDKNAADCRNLRLGLDCLRVGKYQQAEELFVKESTRSEGRQFYALVGLAFIALERDRQQDMGTLLDRATSLAANERERVYIGLLTGRYFALNREYYKAKEAVAGVLRTKGDCSDGRYLDLVIETQDRFDAQVLLRLRRLVEEEPEFFLTALMDPLLRPVQGFVEETENAVFSALSVRAAESLREGRRYCDELLGWLDSQDPLVIPNLKTLEYLEKKHARHSLYDLVDVEVRARNLAAACTKLIAETVKKREQEINAEIRRFESLQRFWKDYPYKPLFPSGSAMLAECRQRLNDAIPAVAKNSADAYRESGRLLEEGRALLANLDGMLSRMLWVQAAIDGCRLFLKRLLFSEGILLLATLAAFQAAPFIDALPPSLRNTLAGPEVQRQAGYLVALLLAPAIAFVFTLLALREKK